MEIRQNRDKVLQRVFHKLERTRKSLNMVISNYETNSGGKFISGIVDLRRFSRHYLTSDEVSHFTALGPRGQANIIKKIPCNGDYVATLYHNTSARHDHIDVSRKLLKALDFK